MLVLSGCLAPPAMNSTELGKPAVEIRNRIPKPRWSGAGGEPVLGVCSAAQEVHDVAPTVTAPFMLPYAAAAAARVGSAPGRRGSRRPLSRRPVSWRPAAAAIDPRQGNAWRQRADVSGARCHRHHRARHRGAADALSGTITPEKISFIPNSATLEPGVRPIEPDNPYRRLHAAGLMVGLSGNLGFTHDPDVVFDVAQLLREPLPTSISACWGGELVLIGSRNYSRTPVCPM